MRMRTLSDAYEHIHASDPGTALTKTGLRRLVTTGVIPSVRIGAKYLISLEVLESYLSNSGEINNIPAVAPVDSGIRRIIPGR